MDISLNAVTDAKYAVLEHSQRRAQIDPDDLVFYVDLAATGLSLERLKQDLEFSPRKGFNPELLDGRLGTVAGMNVLTERSPEVPDEVRGLFLWCVYEVRQPLNVQGAAK